MDPTTIIQTSIEVFCLQSFDLVFRTETRIIYFKWWYENLVNYLYIIAEFNMPLTFDRLKVSLRLYRH